MMSPLLSFLADLADDAQIQEDEIPLTVLAKHPVRDDARAEFERLYHEAALLQEKNFPGYLSSELIRPLQLRPSLLADDYHVKQTDDIYISIYRYNSYSNLKRFMELTERQEFLAQASRWTQGPQTVEYSFHALENFFAPTTTKIASKRLSPPPPKWKLLLVYTAVVFALQQWLPRVVDSVFSPVTVERVKEYNSNHAQRGQRTIVRQRATHKRREEVTMTRLCLLRDHPIPQSLRMEREPFILGNVLLWSQPATF